MSHARPQRIEALIGLHVLLVEDDLRSACLLETVLAFHGAVVTTVRSAGAARRFLRSVIPHVLVIALPTHDECAPLLHEVRPGGPTPVPALALTSLGMDGRRAALDLGFQDCLTKPVDPPLLCAVVGQLGRASRRPDAAPSTGERSRRPSARTQPGSITRRDPL